jgi:hypothetical protein
VTIARDRARPPHRAPSCRSTPRTAGHDQLRERAWRQTNVLALAVDGDDRVRHRAQAVDRHRQRGALEPVGQLPGHHVAGPDAERPQADGDAIGAAAQVAVGELAAALAQALEHEDPLRIGRQAGVEHRGQGRLGPFAGRLVAGAAVIGWARRLHGGPRSIAPAGGGSAEERLPAGITLLSALALGRLFRN